ncbi:MAG TPA: extradiol ring-cleavage dioxygenase [Chloroflexota bacterium]|nr:extradiol ring-cleavage dioxygenase [Chloroflexota bacterium]
MAATDSSRAHGSALRHDVQDGLLAKLDKTARINKLIFEVRLDPAARECLAADTEGVMAAYELSEAERAAVRARDFKGLIELGGHPYLVAQLSRLLYGTANNRNTSTAAEMLRRSVVGD